MTILFQNANVAIAAGTQVRGPFQLPGGIKKQLVGLGIRLSMGAEQFPVGHTDVTVELSIDGGVTYRGASMGINMPASFRGPPPHFWVLEYALDDNAVPTHARATTVAPSAFSTSVLIEAVDVGTPALAA